MTATRKPTRLTCGDLEGMDAGQLREHLALHIEDTSRGAYPYIDGIAGRIERLTGVDRFQVIDHAYLDAEVAG